MDLRRERSCSARLRGWQRWLCGGQDRVQRLPADERRGSLDDSAYQSARHAPCAWPAASILLGGTLFGGIDPVTLNAVVPNKINVYFPGYVDPSKQAQAAALAGLPAAASATANSNLPYFVNNRFLNSPRSSVWDETAPANIYVSQQLLSDPGFGYIGVGGYPFTKGLHTLAKALYLDAPVPGDTPENQTTLDALAKQLAKDFWDWQTAPILDEVYPGILAWQIEGGHDVIWTYRGGKCTTRAQRRPLNFQQTEFQHSIGTTYGVGGRSVALTVQDSETTTQTGQLMGSLQMGDDTLTVEDGEGFPAPPFKVAIDQEVLTVYEVDDTGDVWSSLARGVDGTAAAFHNNGTLITLLLPSAVFGCNLLTFDGATVTPGSYTDGLCEAIVSLTSNQPFYDITTLTGFVSSDSTSNMTGSITLPDSQDSSYLIWVMLDVEIVNFGTASSSDWSGVLATIFDFTNNVSLNSNWFYQGIDLTGPAQFRIRGTLCVQDAYAAPANTPITLGVQLTGVGTANATVAVSGNMIVLRLHPYGLLRNF